LDQEKKQTPTSAKVVAVLLIMVLAAAGIAAFVLYADPARRARRYASRIGKHGDNGILAMKIIDLGADVAIPVALDMLKRDDDIGRLHGIHILANLNAEDKVRVALDDILAAMENEDVVQNRRRVCGMLNELCRARPQYCSKMLQFLKDPDAGVRKMAVGTIMVIADSEEGDRTPEYWIKWLERRKQEEKPPAD